MTILTPAEAKRLAQLEQTIQAGISIFWRVGAALEEIRQRRLYRGHGFKTFELYCRDRWGWGRRHADRLIDAAQVCKERQARGLPLPENERQARALAMQARAPVEEDLQDALAGLPPEVQATVLNAAEEDTRPQRTSRVVQGGDGWPETLKAIEYHARLMKKLIERRGPEADDALPLLERLMEMVRSWPADGEVSEAEIASWSRSKLAA